MAKLKYKIVGDIAAIGAIVAFIPLLVQTTRTKRTAVLSYQWLIIGLTTQFLWIYYGFSNGIVPLLISGVFFACAYGYLLILKYYNEYGKTEAQIQSIRTRTPLVL